MNDRTQSFTYKELVSHKNSITSIKYSNDLQYIMSSSQDGTIKLWNPSLSSPLLKTYSHLHTGSCYDISIFSDNSKFISCGDDSSSFLIDSLSSKIIRRFRGHSNRINCVALNKEETILITGSADMRAKVYDINSHDEIQNLDQAKDSITSVNIVNTYLYTASVDGCLRVYDIRKGEMIKCDCGVPISSFDVSFDGKIVLISSLNDSIEMFDVDKEKCIKEFKGYHQSRNYLMKIKFDPKDKGGFTNSEDGHIAYYDFLDSNKNFYLKKTNSITTSLDVKYNNKDNRCNIVFGTSDAKIFYTEEK